MPRNTIADKAAAGPLNTLNGETITVLTPGEELTAANAEIKWLWELLEARDIPIFSNDLLDRLAMVLKALA